MGSDKVSIERRATDDKRSYHISSQKIKRELGFTPKHSIENAIREMVDAYCSGKMVDPMNNIRYYNVKTMKALKLR